MNLFLIPAKRIPSIECCWLLLISTHTHTLRDKHQQHSDGCLYGDSSNYFWAEALYEFVVNYIECVIWIWMEGIKVSTHKNNKKLSATSFSSSSYCWVKIPFQVQNFKLLIYLFNHFLISNQLTEISFWSFLWLSYAFVFCEDDK